MRHSLINDTICRTLVRAGISASREPTGLLVGSALRPDGVTLIPWARDKCLAWGATVSDTLAASHLSSTQHTAGSAANLAAVNKRNKYSGLDSKLTFVAVAVETLGPWSDEGLKFVEELGRRTSVKTGDPRETTFLFQRIGVAIQRGNAASVSGSLPSCDLSEL